MRAGAEVDEIAVAIERDFFVGRNVFDDVDLEFARLRPRSKSTKFTTFRHGQSLISRNFHALEWMIRFDLLLHLGLNLFEIVGRNPVGKIDIEKIERSEEQT